MQTKIEITYYRRDEEYTESLVELLRRTFHNGLKTVEIQATHGSLRERIRDRKLPMTWAGTTEWKQGDKPAEFLIVLKAARKKRK